MSVPVAVLISGRGSNLGALIAGQGAYKVAAVISNRPDAGGLARAAAAGVEALAIDHKPFGADREAHERAIHAALSDRGVSLVALAGYMRVLTPFLVGAWAGRMLNIHPALLPAFPGLDTHARALKAGVKIHGCTVHWVSEGVDEGPILGQAALTIDPRDDPESLAQRVLALEHLLFPACLTLAAGGAPATPAAPGALFSLARGP